LIGGEDGQGRWLSQGAEERSIENALPGPGHDRVIDPVGVGPGIGKMVFASGVGHYDDPPPDLHDHCFGDWRHAEFNLGIELHNPAGQQTRSSSSDEVVRSRCPACKTRSSA